MGLTWYAFACQGGCRTGMAKVTNGYDLPVRYGCWHVLLVDNEALICFCIISQKIHAWWLDSCLSNLVFILQKPCSMTHVFHTLHISLLAHQLIFSLIYFPFFVLDVLFARCNLSQIICCITSGFLSGSFNSFFFLGLMFYLILC